MDTTDLTTIILRDIRDDIAKLDAKLNARLDTELAKLDAKFDAKLDAVHEELEKRVTRDEFRGAMSVLGERMDRIHTRLVENDVRAITAHHELQVTLSRLTEYLDAHGGLEIRVGQCEQDITDLKSRVL